MGGICMSIASNAGARSAALEIINFIRQKLADSPDDPTVAHALGEILDKAMSIYNAADSGWY